MNNRRRNLSNGFQPPFQSNKKSSNTSSAKNNKKSQLFITESNINSHQEQIKFNYKELNNYLLVLDQKIKKKIGNNEAQLLFAYRNHLSKVKEELQVFKNQTLSKIKEDLTVSERMRQMEAQIILLRQQALKLFDLVSAKDSLICNLNMKMSQLQSQRINLSNLVKQLSKNHKISIVKEYNESLLQRRSQNTQIFNKSSIKSTLGMTSYKKSVNRYKKMHDKTLSSVMKYNHEELEFVEMNNREQSQNQNSKTQFKGEMQTYFKTRDPFQEKFRVKLSFLDGSLREKIVDLAREVIEDLEKGKSMSLTEDFEIKQAMRTTNIQRKKSNMRSKTQSHFYKRKSVLKDYNKSVYFKENQKVNENKKVVEYFKRCIDIVKQQILRRQNNKAKPNFYNNAEPISLQQFKKIDFFRLLELFVYNQQVIETIHDKLSK